MAKLLIFFLLIPIALIAQPEKDTLQIAVYDSPPFGMKSETGELGGLMVEIWEDIAIDMDVDYEYHLTDMESLLQGIKNKTYDIGLGAISITPERDRIVDFTHAVNPSGNGIAISKENNSASFLNKWGPIITNLLKLISVLVLMLLLSAVIVWIAEKKYSDKLDSDTSIKSIADGLWWSAVTMTTVGYGDKVPYSKTGKILGVIWIFTSIIFFSLFTANASSQLSNPKFSTGINTNDDLRKMRVVAVSNSSGEEYLIRENIKYSPEENIENAIDAVLNNRADALVSSVPILKYLNKTFYKDKLLISKNYLLKNNMGIALQVESELKEQINILLLEKIVEPKWQYSVYNYIGD